VTAAPSREEIAAAFRAQSKSCADLGSPLYAFLLSQLADDVAAGGAAARLLEGWRGRPLLDNLPLRLLGGLHRLVMDGADPALAAHFPSTGGAPDFGRLPADFAAALDRHAAPLRSACDEPVQTNEIGRSAALLPGFLRVAAETGLPLRVLEIGSSAGLNLLFDLHRYELGPHRWGDPAAPVTIRATWEGGAPELAAPLRVASRLGSDPQPLDLRDDTVVRRLASFVFPEHAERRERFARAVALARRSGVTVERASAAELVRRELAAPAPGVATVLFHSVIWWYVPRDEQQEVIRCVHDAGRRATPQAPLYWLRMEGASLDAAELRLARVGPRAPDAEPEDVLLGQVHWHGRHVRWLAPQPSTLRDRP